MQLYKAMLVATFGRGKHFLLEAALIRISILGLAAITLGIWLASHTPPLPHIVQPATTFYALIFLVHITCLMVLLCSYAVVRPRTQGIIARLLLFLPLRTSVRWFSLVLPGVILCALALLLVLPLCIVLLAGTIFCWLLPFGVILAAASALGWIYGLPKRLKLLSLFITSGVLWVEYALLHIPDSGSPAVLLIARLGFIYTLCCGSLLLVFSRYNLCHELGAVQRSTRIHTYLRSPVWWNIKKLFRSSLTGNGFWITLFVGAVLAGVSKKLGLGGDTILSDLIALLAAAQASDIRRTTRLTSPTEIVGLKGTFYFGYKQSIGGLVVCGLAASPLIVIALLQSASPCITSAYILASLLLGVFAGIWAGTFFAAQQKDITTQCCATTVALGTILLPQAPPFSGLSATSHLIIQILLAGLLLTVALGTEFKRNRYTWRV